MRIRYWILPLMGRIDPSKAAYDLQVHSPEARKAEPWWRHKVKREIKIPWYEKVIILSIAFGIILFILWLVDIFV